MILSQIRKNVNQLVAGGNITLTPADGIGVVTISTTSGGGGGVGSETDTLAAVTARGASTASSISILNTTDTTSSSTGALVVSGGVGIGTDLQVGGDVYSFNFSTASDERLKTNIKSLTNSLDIINNIQGRRFNYNQELDVDSIGFIAQEIEQYVPEAVSERLDGYKTISYDMIIPILVEAVKTLTSRIQQLETSTHTHG